MNLDAERRYARSLGLGLGGALLFALPLLMTMEMWQLGLAMDRTRLVILLVMTMPVLVGLSYFAGFEPTFRWKDEILDALAAFAIGVALAASVLALFGALRLSHAPGETVGKIVLCAIPGAIGALLAGKQFADMGVDREETQRPSGYLAELFTMMVGALFLAFNIAPTEEVPLIAQQMGPVRSLLLVLLSVLVLHGVVYQLGLPGQDLRRGQGGALRAFVLFSIPGYGLALLVSLYTLWTLGRLDGVSAHEALAMIVVLAFPAALGCATARLVI
ncbi:TIGR02587 family membrane protein [Phenylobacterium sp. LjRoot164]|uniref:TIGR02587 family membrane protein n=1 Tax=unclassified Phenylobacterium TaxID=2640670 RepID=UPI003ECC8629